MAVDPNFDDVVLLLPPAGPNGSVVFPDASSFAQVVTPAGIASVTDVAPPFVGTFLIDLSPPVLLDPAGELDIDDAVSLNFSTGDWTVEFFYKRSFTADSFFLTKTNFDARFPYQLSVDAAGILHVESADTAGGTIQSRTAINPIPDDTWTHIAYERNGSDFRLYIAGIEILTGSVLAPYAGDLGDNGAPVRFIGPPTGTEPIDLAQVRFSKGIARYAPGDFAPPVGPFPTSGPPTQVLVPPIVNLTPIAANIDIVAVSLIPGVPTTEGSLTVPLGLIIRQSPAGGTLVDVGTVVNYVVSSGFIEAPDLYNDTAAQANTELMLVGLGVGPATTGFSDAVKYGSVMAQVPPAGAHLLPGSPVSYTISVPRSDFDVDRTVISQYQNSPTLLRLVHNMDEYIDEGITLANFYQYIWNVDTAVGFGLDIWGRIVGVSRLLQIPGNDPIVGFDNASVPKDWYPMSEGRFATENEVTTAYELPDDAYRVLVLTKALANIITTTAPALNQLLRNMFPGRGRAFVRDLGNMAMQFVFNFSLTPVEYAILTQSGVLPHPAGVFYSVTVIPGGLFGFQGYTGALPFNYGVFNSRP